ncbi:lipase family protein [Nocardia sp. NBC_01503]|uniref:lipase family protein n=1 Tax=Nocardia sp. NBC_01503 TaxID=2975997 RepID=UPI002E7BCE0F|nr:lipase family protein [Nocardia sp. NBC_01503]WTL34095.1 lipase family protein [Nocardia sp. NBC_01503]
MARYCAAGHAESSRANVIRRRLSGRVRAGLAGLVGVLIAVLVMPGAWAEGVPVPDEDPFYVAPSGLEANVNGAVLNSRPISVLGLGLPVAGWQLQYRSTDSAGGAVADVATVMTPLLPWLGGGGRPLLSYQVAEDSLGTRCAPSFALRGGRDFSIVNTALDIPFLTAMLLRGWAVVVSDYEGPQSRFFDGVNSGRGVLDGVRAARSFAPVGITADSPIGAWGYSGGAFATLWAMQQRASYAPELWFSGVAAGGVPADIAAISRKVDGGIQAGLAVLMVVAFARIDPDSGLAEDLNDRGRELLVRESAACGADMVLRHLNRQLDEYSDTPNLLWHPQFQAATDRQELGAVAPDMPLYMYHSNADDVIPVGGFTALVHRYCALGANISVVHSGIPGHNPAAAVESIGAMNYLGDRFAGIPAAAGCTG